jgi:hypothetical protein
MAVSILNGWGGHVVRTLTAEDPQEIFDFLQCAGLAIVLTSKENGDPVASTVTVEESFDGVNWATIDTLDTAGDTVVLDMTETLGLIRITYTPTAYEDEVLASTPNLFYRLGEPSGTTAADSSGNGLDGTYVNTPTLGVEGALVGDSNTAVSFNGTDEKVTVPDDALGDLGNTMTISFWIKPATLGTNGWIVDKSSAAYAVWRDSAGKIKFSRSENTDLAISSAVAPANVWTHVAVTKTGTTSKIYMNGVDVTVPLADSTCTNSVDDLWIGARHAASAFFRGVIDEVALYPTALSAAAVLGLYQAGLQIESVDVTLTGVSLPANR